MGLVRCGRERAQPHSRLIRIGGRASQDSSSLATLGFVAESLRDSCDPSAKMWVMTSPGEMAGVRGKGTREQKTTPYVSSLNWFCVVWIHRKLSGFARTKRLARTSTTSELS